MNIFSAIIKQLNTYAKLAVLACRKCFSYSIYEMLEKLKTRDLLRLVFWMSGYTIVAMAFSVLLYRLVNEPHSMLLSNRFRQGKGGTYACGTDH